MEIATKHFGLIELTDEKIITFIDELPGLGGKHYVLLSPPDMIPFSWLQSVDNPEAALVVVNPAEILSSYQPEISGKVYEELCFEPGDECLVLVVAVVPDDIRKMTMNLAAPIIVNVDKRLAKQEILAGEEYPLRYCPYEEYKAKGVYA